MGMSKLKSLRWVTLRSYPSFSAFVDARKEEIQTIVGEGEVLNYPADANLEIDGTKVFRVPVRHNRVTRQVPVYRIVR